MAEHLFNLGGAGSGQELPALVSRFFRVSTAREDTFVAGLWAGIEHLVLLATEVEDRFHAIPSLACAADMARAAIGA